MERSDRDRKHKNFRISRRGENEPRPLQERLRGGAARLRGLLQRKPALLIALCLFVMVVNAPSLIRPGVINWVKSPL